ncbi:MAG: transposase family protein [Clostridiales bacterium]|mgnify:CR=1 FL=1|nr:transposase family protein [Clostridiales bacterium]
MVKNKMIDYFGIITDQRQKAKIKHKLTDILFISVVGTLANCDSWVAIDEKSLIHIVRSGPANTE